MWYDNRMEKNKVFQIAFLISLAVHGFILVQSPNFAFLPRQKEEQRMEVSYIEPDRKAAAMATPAQAHKDPVPELPVSKMSAKKTIPPPFVDKEAIFKEKASPGAARAELSKPSLAKSDVISVKKVITLPPVNLDNINNPSYVSYYQIVREKIRRAAYHNYTRTETGEVNLSFVISRDGFLKDMRLLEEKSSPDPYLRDTALQSIRDASPFPAFPKDLDYPQLSFNVAISFQIE